MLEERSRQLNNMDFFPIIRSQPMNEQTMSSDNCNDMIEHDRLKDDLRCDNQDDQYSDRRVIFKWLSYATALTCLILYLNQIGKLDNNKSYVVEKQRSKISNNSSVSTRILSEIIPNDVNDTVIEQTEILCKDDYSSIADLSYTYYLETTQGTNITQIINRLEQEMLVDLADSLLFCDIVSRGSNKKRSLQQGSDEGLIDEYSLNILGISSRPDDTPSTKSTCKTTEGRDCTVVLGSLFLFLNGQADVPTVQYATRYAIREFMSQNVYVGKIEGIESVNYVAPNLVVPSPNTGNAVGVGQEVNAGGSSYQNNRSFSRLEIVVAATLVSTIVALLASFVLFKRVYSKQNCMAPCDGTGIDKEYMQSSNLGVTPVGEVGGDFESVASKSSSWNMRSVVTTTSGGLHSIDEDSVAASDSNSIYSDQTMVIRNSGKNSTPLFGNYSAKENKLEVI